MKRMTKLMELLHLQRSDLFSHANCSIHHVHLPSNLHYRDEEEDLEEELPGAAEIGKQKAHRTYNNIRSILKVTQRQLSTTKLFYQKTKKEKRKSIMTVIWKAVANTASEHLQSTAKAVDYTCYPPNQPAA